MTLSVQVHFDSLQKNAGSSSDNSGSGESTRIID